MAETLKSKTDALALIVVGGNRATSAQDLRDVVHSVWGVYGELYVKNGQTNQVVGTTPLKMTGFASVGNTSGMTANVSTDTLTVDAGGAGVYLVSFFCSFTGSNNTVYECYLNVNDEEGTNGFHRKIGTGADVGTAGFTGLVTLADGDVCSVYVEASADTSSFVPENAQFTLVRVG